jgi:hypothetical protein
MEICCHERVLIMKETYTDPGDARKFYGKKFNCAPEKLKILRI